MKTFNKYRLNNKGAALISVMIAVAFVTILSTTLLYISMNNYQMKVVNSKSKENFYDADDKMVTLTSRVQNTVATSKSSQIKSNVMTAIGATASSPTVVEGNTYETGICSAQSLAKLVFPEVDSGSGVVGTPSGGKYIVTDKNGDKYVFDSAEYSIGPKLKSDGKTADGSIKEIQIKNVKIQKLSATSSINSVTESTFDDTVSTNMVFEYYEPTSSPQDGGVGTFSLLMDNSVSLKADDNVRLNIYGNGYMSNYNRSNMSADYVGSDGATHKVGTAPGGNALVIGDNSMVNALGDNLIVYGDCVIKRGGVLNVAHGSLTVYGKLEVQGGGTLLVGGTVYMSDEKLGAGVYKYGCSIDSNAVVRGKSGAFDPVADIKRIDPEPFKKALKLNDTSADNDGVVPNITKKAKINGTEYKFHEQCDSETSSSDFTYDNKGYHVKFFNKGIMNNGDLKDSLVFIGDGCDCTLREENVNATIISMKPITCDQKHVVDLTCIGDGVFNYVTGKNSSGTYNFKMHVRMKGGREGDVEVGDFFASDANKVASAMLGGATGNAGGGSDPVPDKVTARFSNWQKN